MKYLILTIKIITAPWWFPIWLPFWLLKKTWRFLLLAFFVSLIDGCAVHSNRFEKSPCACDFQPINNEYHRGVHHA